ncbi:MAG: hypothetical protein ACOY5Y_15755 [Pseudomonadota bacterium]
MTDPRTDQHAQRQERREPGPGEGFERRASDAVGGPGHTSEAGEGGGVMSGRGQEGETPRAPEVDAEPAAANAGPGSPIRGPGGVSTDLQPGGARPDGGPGASEGSIGTGGGSTAGADTGAVKRHQRR